MAFNGTNERPMTYAEAAAKQAEDPEVRRAMAIRKEAEERAEDTRRRKEEIITVYATARMLKRCIQLRARGMSLEETFQECGRLLYLDPGLVCSVVTEINRAAVVDTYFKKPEHVRYFYRYFGNLF